MTNKGPQTCHTQGYVGVGLNGTDGKPAPLATSRLPSGIVISGSPPQPVTLAPGSAALFVLVWVTRPPDGQSSCPKYGALVVTPPDDTSTVPVDLGPGYLNNGLAICGAAIEIRPLEAEPERCHVDHLTFELTRAGPEPQMPSHGFGFISIKNIGASTCRMYGWPGFQLQSASGQALPVRGVRTSGPPQMIIVKPDDLTSFAFTWDAGCASPLVPAKLQIIPPDERTSAIISAQAKTTGPNANGVIAVCQGQVQLLPVG